MILLCVRFRTEHQTVSFRLCLSYGRSYRVSLCFSLCTHLSMPPASCLLDPVLLQHLYHTQPQVMFARAPQAAVAASRAMRLRNCAAAAAPGVAERPISEAASLASAQIQLPSSPEAGTSPVPIHQVPKQLAGWCELLPLPLASLLTRRLQEPSYRSELLVCLIL